jgi:hypothetical protein
LRLLKTRSMMKHNLFFSSNLLTYQLSEVGYNNNRDRFQVVLSTEMRMMSTQIRN